MTPPNWFIALPLPATAAPAGMTADLPAGTRAFHPDDLHVTVAFLGPVDAERAEAAWALVPEAGTPLDATLGPRAVFGPPRRPSAIGLDLDGGTGDGAVARFVAAWRDPLREAVGLPPETREARPHVTLGRPPRNAGRDWRRALGQWLRRPVGETVLRFDGIALYTRADDDPARRFRIVHRRAWTTHGPDRPGR